METQTPEMSKNTPPLRHRQRKYFLWGIFIIVLGVTILYLVFVKLWPLSDRILWLVPEAVREKYAESRSRSMSFARVEVCEIEGEKEMLYRVGSGDGHHYYSYIYFDTKGRKLSFTGGGWSADILRPRKDYDDPLHFSKCRVILSDREASFLSLQDFVRHLFMSKKTVFVERMDKELRAHVRDKDTLSKMVGLQEALEKYFVNMHGYPSGTNVRLGVKGQTTRLTDHGFVSEEADRFAYLEFSGSEQIIDPSDTFSPIYIYSAFKNDCMTPCTSSVCSRYLITFFLDGLTYGRREYKKGYYYITPAVSTPVFTGDAPAVNERACGIIPEAQRARARDEQRLSDIWRLMNALKPSELEKRNLYYPPGTDLTLGVAGSTTCFRFIDREFVSMEECMKKEYQHMAQVPADPQFDANDSNSPVYVYNAFKSDGLNDGVIPCASGECSQYLITFSFEGALHEYRKGYYCATSMTSDIVYTGDAPAVNAWACSAAKK